MLSNRTAVPPGTRTRALRGEKCGFNGSRRVLRSSWTEDRFVMSTLEKGWISEYPRTGCFTSAGVVVAIMIS